LTDTDTDRQQRQEFGWGIIGTGRIASDFASDLKLLKDARLAAVLSRSQSSADAFAQKNGAAAAYSDIDRFMADKSIDIVYIATPNSMHLPQALRAIRAGKAVLIEKPVAPSEPEAAVLSREAGRNKIFVMEAMWIRFLPGIGAVKSLIEAGEIGNIQSVRGALAWRNAFDPQSRLFNKALGGGASLDLGVYLLSLTLYLLGEPERISGAWTRAPSGVDMRAYYRLHFKDSAAELECGLDRNLANIFEVKGSKGTIRIGSPFIGARRIEVATTAFAQRIMALCSNGIAAKILARLPFPGHRVMQFDYQGHGLSFQAEAVMQALRCGETGHKSMPMSDSAAVLRAIAMLMSFPPTG
jgi:predicted dehydrogenase